ncbi:polysaccharide biosynthesis C-terminal domain-containing protein [Loigolactobacillus backii]|uniref:oligosaccharide flippase family protein n=1 Tax=Loigolactobacillus backii TaxID=375175 RepID=UPI0022FD9223|nr:polysaccharide biosynthesis C-terminal domain-containing protein [Loigolactobacillus backii]MDA5388288.1 polysaccharide biosynthesis C-terminal domain-containing protein [Loigolactobacillus backii]MDA5390782.1 polysaccharide biosynthesis C-terminal domain-containing protein [Loigolactobacillus backii]
MKILKNYLYNATYQLFIIIVPLITIPYISRTIGPHGVGINTFTNSVIQYFILLATLGLTMYGNRQIAYTRNNKVKMTKTFWEIEFLICITVSISYLMFFIFLQINNGFQAYYLAQSVTVIAVAFDISWFFMGVENFRVTVIRNAIIKIISVILIFMFVKNSNDLLKYILINSLSVLVGNITFWPYLKKYLVKINFRSLNIFTHLKPALILFIPQIATNIYVVLNKTMLGAFSNIEAAGYFDNSDKIIKITLAVLTSLATVMMPRVANTFATGNRKKVNEYLKSSLDFTILMSIPMMFGISAIAVKFAPWFLGDDFKIVGKVMELEAPVILVIAIASVTGNQYLLPTNRNKEYTISVTFGAVINLVLNIPLIIYYGALGTAIATVISELCVTLTQIYFMRKLVNMGDLFADFWKYLLSGIVMYVFVKILNIILNFNILTLLLQILVGILIYLVMIFITHPSVLDFIRTFIRNNNFKFWSKH